MNKIQQKYFLTCFLWMGLCLFNSVFAQEHAVTLDCRNEPLKSVLGQFASQSQTNLVFSDLLVREKRVNCRLRQQSIEDALANILPVLNMSFQRLSPKMIVIFEKPTEPTKIKGIVVDANDQVPLPYANIQVKGTAQGGTSNNDGYFSIEALPTDLCTLKVSYIGYGQEELPAWGDDPKSLVKVEMKQNPILTENVIVTGKKYHSFEISNKEAGRLRFSPQVLNLIPATGNADFQRTVQLLPGVSAGYDKSSELRILGSSREHNLILLDDIQVVTKPELYFGMLNPFHAQAIETVNVHKGGYSAKFDDCIGGVIELTGNSVRNNKFKCGFGMDYFNVNTFFQIPVFKNLKWFFAANRSLKNIDDGPIYQDIYNAAKENTKTIFESYDIMGGAIAEDEDRYSFFRVINKFTCMPSKKDELSLTFYSGNEREMSESHNYNSMNEYNSKYNWKWHSRGWSVKWRHQFHPRFNFRFVVAENREFRPYDYDQTKLGLENIEKTQYSQTSLRHRIRKLIFKNHNQLNLPPFKLDFGWSISFLKMIFEDEQIRYFPYLVEPFNEKVYDGFQTQDETQKNAFFLQTHFFPIKKLDFGLGVRIVSYESGYSWEDRWSGGVEKYPAEKNGPHQYLLPRVSFNYQLFHQVSLKSAWGRYYQFEYTQKDGGDIKNGTYELWWQANNKFQPISADHLLVELSIGRADWAFDLEGFYKDFRHINWHEAKVPVYFEKKEHIQLNGMFEYFYYGSGFAGGFEVTLKKSAGWLTGWLSYKYENIQQRFPEINFGKSLSPNFHRVHELKMVGNLKLRNWRLTTVGVLASPVQATENEILIVQGFWNYKYDFNLPACLRIDANISRKINNFMLLDWEFGLSLLNILNQKSLIQRIVENNPELGYMEIRERKMLPFLPLLYLNITYTR